jgi:hypothetical protein
MAFVELHAALNEGDMERARAASQSIAGPQMVSFLANYVIHRDFRPFEAAITGALVPKTALATFGETLMICVLQQNHKNDVYGCDDSHLTSPFTDLQEPRSYRGIARASVVQFVALLLDHGFLPMASRINYPDQVTPLHWAARVRAVIDF